MRKQIGIITDLKKFTVMSKAEVLSPILLKILIGGYYTLAILRERYQGAKLDKHIRDAVGKKRINP